MKKYVSVLSLIARHSIYKVFLILLGLAAVNALVFGLDLGQTINGMHYELDKMPILIVLVAAFALLTLVLCSTLCDRGGHQNYFLNRISISHEHFYLIHVVYHVFCYCMLFAMEALSLLGLCLFMQIRFPESFNHQSIMLACYQSDLLHSVFPVSDILGWVTNVFLILGMGFCTAAFPTRNRSRKRSLSTFMMVGASAFYFYVVTENGALDMEMKLILIFAAIIFALSSAMGCLSLEVDASV